MGREIRDARDTGGYGQCNCAYSSPEFITCYLHRLLEWGLLSHVSPKRFISLTLLCHILTCHCLKIRIKLGVGAKKAENELFQGRVSISSWSGPKIVI